MLTCLATKVSYIGLSVNQDCLPQTDAELSQTREPCLEQTSLACEQSAPEYRAHARLAH
jgi:hypothetical protein